MATNDEKASRFEGLGGKLIALVVLAIAAYVLFKIVIGIVTGIAITLAVIVAVLAFLWALNRLL
jgi:Flp pilus assembly protein TadB